MSLPLYRELADDLAEAIRGGVYAAGERLPSVRQLCRDRGVSMTTATQALRELESRRVAVSRPRSGYFACDDWQQASLLENRTARTAPATEVTVSELIGRVLTDSYRSQSMNLGTAIPGLDLLPTAAMTRLMAKLAKESPAQVNRYAFGPGNEELRVQLCRQMATRGVKALPNEIIITNGCYDAVMTALQVICKRGDTVAVESPTFYLMLQGLELQGLKALEIPTDPETGISLAALGFALEHHPIDAVLLTPTFSNPLGCVMPPEAKADLVRLLARHNVPLIEDDIYGDLHHDGPRPPACKSFDEAGLVVYCSSFSKTIGPGFRVGWMMGGRFHEAIVRRRSVSDFSGHALSQLAVARFLADGSYERHLRRLRSACGEQVMRMRSAVATRFPAGTRVSRPRGGLLVWVELPESVDGLNLYDRAHREGIGIIPGHLFSASGKYTHHIRLNGGVGWSEEVSEAIYRLGRLAGRGSGAVSQ